MINLKSCAEEIGVYYAEGGDTISSVAEKFSTSREILIRDNNLKCEIEEGECLYIRKFSKVYTVKVGDTFDSVAKELGTSVEELKRVNGIEYIYPYMQVVYE